MGIGTPFHSRTSPLCKSMQWRVWAGYYSAISYETNHDREYFAVRHSAAMIDVSPLHKYRISGPDALRLVDRVVTRRMFKSRVGQVYYTCWCNDQGKVIDDGTVARIAEDAFRITSANPSLNWFGGAARGLKVKIEDESESLAALALQGPTSREILKRVADGDLEGLKYFRVMDSRIGSIPVAISRTGYTGDLGYEIWVSSRRAVKLWDALLEGGKDYGITPAGLNALDLTRIEAGYILIDCDFISARRAISESQKSTPFEIGLNWTVHLDKEGFIGRRALVEEQRRGPRRRIVGLEIDWEELEKLYDQAGLPPQLPAAAWREIVPLTVPGGRQVGWASSGCWSPTLKKYIAIASVNPDFAEIGTRLRMDSIVDYQKKRVIASVVPRPFFDPPRKRS